MYLLLSVTSIAAAQLVGLLPFWYAKVLQRTRLVVPGVLVAVTDRGTGRVGADIHALIQAEISSTPAIAVTQLAGRIKASHFHQPASSPWHFAFEQIQQCTEGGIGKRTRDTAVLA